MVALHNKKLTQKEIFRGVLWTDKEWFEVRDAFERQLEAENAPEPRIFQLSRMMEGYQRTQPTMRDRQQIMARIYPPKKVIKGPFTEEEIHWLTDHLDRVNDPVGQDILAKVKALLP